jgi:peptide deformylase
MILPIVAYGSPILRKVAEEISSDYPELKKLLEDMWETLYNSNGVGLAAPQINKSIRLFLVDSAQVFENDEDGDMDEYTDKPGIKETFINPKILALDGELWSYNEGCLSIPKVREDVYRNQTVTISYLNENFELITNTFSGLTARIILHEYDHLEGKLFIDYIKPLKRTLLKRKLEDISKGKITMDYRMIYPK